MPDIAQKLLDNFSLLISTVVPILSKKLLTCLSGGQIGIGPFLIEIGGRGIALTILTFLIISYKGKTLKSFYESGLPGFFGGIILSFGFCGYVFAMYNTTVANTNFIISLQILFLAIFGYFFLKEKINTITLTSIVLFLIGTYSFLPFKFLPFLIIAKAIDFFKLGL